MKIADIVVGEYFYGVVMIKELTTRTATSKYWDLKLVDKDSSVGGVFWDVTPELETLIKAGDLVYIEGPTQIYRDKLQIKVTTISKTHPAVLEVNPADFVEVAPIPEKEMIHRILEILENIQDDEIKRICLLRAKEAGRAFYVAPAAKGIHHAYVSGLAYHVLGMLEMALALLKFRPELNADMLIAGVYLHDIEKPGEMLHHMGTVTDYSFEGKMIGHIVMAVEALTAGCIKLGINPGSEKIVFLKNMLLSHHNLGEWGSPVQPHSPEAVALHYIDQLDAKTQMAVYATSKIEKGTFSERVFALENKQMYRL